MSETKVKASEVRKYNRKIWFNKLKTRLTVAHKILFRKYNHWFLVNLKKSEVKELFTDNLKEVTWHQHGMQSYPVILTMKLVVDSVDEDDLILKRADFEANAELLAKNKMLQ